jgi:hypothetical protein
MLSLHIAVECVLDEELSTRSCHCLDGDEVH